MERNGDPQPVVHENVGEMQRNHLWRTRQVIEDPARFLMFGGETVLRMVSDAEQDRVDMVSADTESEPFESGTTIGEDALTDYGLNGYSDAKYWSIRTKGTISKSDGMIER